LGVKVLFVVVVSIHVALLSYEHFPKILFITANRAAKITKTKGIERSFEIENNISPLERRQASQLERKVL